MTKQPSEAMIEARKFWWSSVCRQGDPMRRPRLVDEAFEAGWQAALPPPAEEPMLTQEEIDELVERINANPNLHPLPPAETGDDDAERDAAGEAVYGFRVAAYRETHPEHGDKYGHSYSEHWSTPNTRDPRVKVERLFTEDQLREAIASRLSSAGDDELVARLLNNAIDRAKKNDGWASLSEGDLRTVLEALSRKGRGE